MLVNGQVTQPLFWAVLMTSRWPRIRMESWTPLTDCRKGYSAWQMLQGNPFKWVSVGPWLKSGCFSSGCASMGIILLVYDILTPVNVSFWNASSSSCSPLPLIISSNRSNLYTTPAFFPPSLQGTWHPPSHQPAPFITIGLLFPSVNISSAPWRHALHFTVAD